MSKNSTPVTTSKSEKGETEPSRNLVDPKSAFIGAVLTMSWQLAIVVLLPVIGGYQLDNHLKTSPLWVIVGFVIAIVGVIGVLKHMLGELHQSFLNPKGKSK